MTEKTLVILKPDAIQQHHVGEIISRFEKRGFNIDAMKMEQLTPDQIKEHYAHLIDSPYFSDISKYMMESPVIIMILSANNVIALVRQMVGATNPEEASPGTIRADFALTVGRNIVHASDSAQSAQKEINHFFPNYKN